MKKFQLQKGLQQRHINMIAFGGIIGSSYFVGTGYVLNQMGPSACVAFILGGIITFLTMSCFTELILARPGPGSFITYAKEFLSPACASGVGWSYWISWIVYVPSECIAGGFLLNHLIPSVPLQFWIVVLGIIVSLINLIHVKAFGELEFWLSWTKILIIAGFSLAAILIFFGWIGADKHEVIGSTFLLDNGGFFPNGVSIFLANLVILISSFQGTEIVGITASETKQAHIAVPKSLKQISWRLFFIYFIPTFLLVSIYPWQEANLSGSVFAAALYMYDLNYLGKIFNILVIAGSISCANSGIYSTIRALHALSVKNIAPKSLQKVSAKGIPINATIVTLAMIWLILSLTFFLSPHALYANLLALTGFAGTIAWIAICGSQFYFRKKYAAKKEKKPLLYSVKFFPYSTQISILLQGLSLILIMLSPELRFSFYFGVPSFVIPMLIYKFTLHYRRKHHLDH